MSSLEDPLYLRWASFTTVLVGLFGTALVLGLAQSVFEVLFLVGVALCVSALYLPGVQAAIGDDRVQFGALFLAMGATVLVMDGAGLAPLLFVLIGALFLGRCLLDRRVASEESPSASS